MSRSRLYRLAMAFFMLTLAVQWFIGPRHREPHFDVNTWLMEKSAAFGNTLVAFEFYEPGDAISMKHLQIVRKIAAEHQASIALVEVDLSTNRQAAQYLYGGRTVEDVPFTVITLHYQGSLPVVVYSARPFPGRDEFTEAGVRQDIEAVLKRY